MDIEVLKAKSGDGDFEQNLKRMVDLGFIKLNFNKVIAINKTENSTFVDLFEISDLNIMNEEFECLEVRNR